MIKSFLSIIIIVIMLAVTTLNAKEVTLEQKISSLYVSFFNRAPDYEGLSYWKNRGEQSLQQGADALVTLKALSAGFAQHPTFTSTYSSMSNEDFVKAIYRNSLGKEGDAEGINYWTTLLINGKSRSDMVAEFMNLSLTVDLTPQNFPSLTQAELDAAIERQKLIANKVDVAVAFADNLKTYTNVLDSQHPENDPAYLASIKVLIDVNENVATATAAIGKLENIKNDPDAISEINSGWEGLSSVIYSNSSTYQYRAWGLGGDADNSKLTVMVNGINYTLAAFSNLNIKQSNASVSSNLITFTGALNSKLITNAFVISNDYNAQEVVIKVFNNADNLNADTMFTQSQVMIVNSPYIIYDIVIPNADDFRPIQPTDTNIGMPPAAPVF